MQPFARSARLARRSRRVTPSNHAPWFLQIAANYVRYKNITVLAVSTIAAQPRRWTGWRTAHLRAEACPAGTVLPPSY